MAVGAAVRCPAVFRPVVMVMGVRVVVVVVVALPLGVRVGQDAARPAPETCWARALELLPQQGAIRRSPPWQHMVCCCQCAATSCNCFQMDKQPLVPPLRQVRYTTTTPLRPPPYKPTNFSLQV